MVKTMTRVMMVLMVLLGAGLALKAAWLPLQLDPPKHTNKYDLLNPDNLVRAQSTATPTANIAATQTAAAGLPAATQTAIAVATQTAVALLTPQAGPLISTVAGTGIVGYTGDNGLATLAQLRSQYGSTITLDSAANLYIGGCYQGNSGSNIRKIEKASGIITTLNGISGTAVAFQNPNTLYVSGPSASALYQYIGGVSTLVANFSASIGYNGGVLTTDITNTVYWGGSLISREASGITTTVTTAVMNESVMGLVADNAGGLYFTDLSNQIKKVIISTGSVSIYAGTGVSGYSGDGGPATLAQMYLNWNGTQGGLAMDNFGNLFVVDANRVRKVTASTGIITTVAGNGDNGSYGDGGAAISAGVQPIALAIGSDGLYILERAKVRKVSPLP
jgi:hypothetical protein